jgi:hypothetical protein
MEQIASVIWDSMEIEINAMFATHHVEDVRDLTKINAQPALMSVIHFPTVSVQEINLVPLVSFSTVEYAHHAPNIAQPVNHKNHVIDALTVLN